MHIMFVCTGNICRAPMGELLLTKYLNGTTVRVSSAGTRGLPMHQIDPSSARLMDSVGIESSGFRSRRLTRQMADEADLILCFEKSQRKDIVALAPAAVRYTFLLSDFANAQRGNNRLYKRLPVKAKTQGSSLIEIGDIAVMEFAYPTTLTTTPAAAIIVLTPPVVTNPATKAAVLAIKHTPSAKVWMIFSVFLISSI